MKKTRCTVLPPLPLPPAERDGDLAEPQPHVIPALPLSFTEADVTALARAAGVHMTCDISRLGQFGNSLKGLAEFFAVAARLQKEPKMATRGKGRPPNRARSSLLIGYLNIYWQMTGRSPNYRDKARQRNSDARALRFVREVIIRNLKQLEHAPEPEARAVASEFRKLLALKDRGLAKQIEKEITFSRCIMRMLCPSAPGISHLTRASERKAHDGSN